MADIMTAIPPIHPATTMTSSDVVTFWVVFGVIIAVVLVATLILAIAGQRSAKKQAQMNEAKQPHEASLQPQGSEQPPAHAPEEEELLLKR